MKRDIYLTLIMFALVAGVVWIMCDWSWVRGVDSRAPGAVQSALPPPDIAGPGVRNPSDAQESSTAPATLPPPAISPVPVAVRPANPSADAPQGPTLRTLFDALWMQEAGRRLDPPDGDGGRAIGPYQIWEAYWIDAGMGTGTHQDCRDRYYAEVVMVRYWRRYCPAALAAVDAETLARVHYGGPHGADTRRAVTDGYWAKVKRIMEEAK